MKLRCKGVRGAEIFFIEEAIPRSIRRRRITELPMTGELASALRTLHISTFHDLVGVSLRDLQRVSDKSAALFLELSRLIKLAAAGRAASVSNRGTGVDRERTTSARPCGSSDKQTGLPKHLIAVLPFARPSSRSAPDWSVSSIHPNSDASSRQPVHPPEDFVSGSQPADSARSGDNNRDDWLADRIFIPVSERGRSLRTLTVSVRLSNVVGQKELHLLGDLHGKTYREIGRYRNCGRKTLEELRSIVRRIQLGGPQSPFASEATGSDPNIISVSYKRPGACGWKNCRCRPVWAMFCAHVVTRRLEIPTAAT